MNVAPVLGQLVRVRNTTGVFNLMDPGGRTAIIITDRTRLRIIFTCDGEPCVRIEGTEAQVRVDPDFLEVCDE